MHLSFKSIILFFSLVFENGLGHRYESKQSPPTQGILLKNCGFKNAEAIVCCNDDSASGTTADDLPKRKSVTISTTKVIAQPTTKTLQTTPFTTQKAILQVGEKSKQKCQEYGKYVHMGFFETITDDCEVIPSIGTGAPGKPKEFPHMALVGFQDAHDIIHWLCSGSLISEKFVLSAAHCTYHREFRGAKYILLGELVLDSTTDTASTEKISIKNTIRHPNYKPPSIYHDIALFELEHDAILNTYTRPACVNTNPSLTNNIIGVASRWGTSGFGDVQITMRNELQKVSLDMFTTTECNHTYRRNIDETLANGIVEETQLCAGSRNDSKDTCEGDSGGPLQIDNGKEVFCTYKIIGITSFGKECGTVNLPGVYTRVSAYIKWIEDNVWP